MVNIPKPSEPPVRVMGERGGVRGPRSHHNWEARLGRRGDRQHSEPKGLLELEALAQRAVEVMERHVPKSEDNYQRVMDLLRLQYNLIECTMGNWDCDGGHLRNGMHRGMALANDNHAVSDIPTQGIQKHTTFKAWTLIGGERSFQQCVAVYLKLPLNAAVLCVDVQRGLVEKRDAILSVESPGSCRTKIRPRCVHTNRQKKVRSCTFKSFL